MTDTPRTVLAFPKIPKRPDCQSERRVVPLHGHTHRMFEAAAKPLKSASWGRGMVKVAFQAIEYEEGLSAALAELERIISEYRP